jgi:hypothetical protein
MKGKKRLFSTYKGIKAMVARPVIIAYLIKVFIVVLFIIMKYSIFNFVW